jgi:integrase
MASRSIAVARPQEQTPHLDPVPIPEPAPKRKRRRVRSQRGSILHRGRSWIAIFRTREGRQKWVTCRSKLEATNCLTDALKLVREDRYTDAQPELFNVYVERWLARRMPTLKPSTWRTYRSFFKTWLTPEFGEQEMRDVTREQVRAFAYRMLESDLSGKSIHMMLVVLHDLFDDAIDDKVAQTNPAHRLNVELPDDSTERHVPEREQVTATFAQLDSNITIQVFLAMATMTGMRRGEVLGLWWDDIDWKKGEIRVQRSLTRANQDECGKFRNIEWHYSKTLAVVPPKTKTSVRTVRMPPELAAMLRSVRARTRNESPFVFQEDDSGAPLNPDRIYKVLFDAEMRAGVTPLFTFHGLRHRFASELQEAGASPAHTRDRMGHSSIEITDRYTHDVGDGRAYADAVARLFPFGVSLTLAERTPAR